MQNVEAQSPSRLESFPYTSFNESPGSAHSLVVNVVPHGSRVLEFGCATGYMSRVLKEDRGCSVVGVELVPEAAELAREHCESVVVADAETLDFDEAFGDDRFDVILFADVLEHLRDPESVLRGISSFVADGGKVVASIPNVAHGSVRLALLSGEFRYRESGLLDKTHLRFFTRETIRDLFEEAGYVVARWHRARLDIEHAEISAPPSTDVARDLLAGDTDVTTYQFITEAVPAREPDLLRALRNAQDHVREEQLERLRQTLAEQQSQLDRLGEQFGNALERERELRTMLVDAHEELLRKDADIRRLTNEFAPVMGTPVWRWATRAVGFARSFRRPS